MGHTQSSNSTKQNSLGEWRDFFCTQSHLLKQVASLKYGDFVQAVEGLNTISNTLSHSNGKYLVFSIIPGTDCTTILWKSRVRIKCCKMTYADSQCESMRTMTLKQFVQVYDSIMQQCKSIKDRLRMTDGTSNLTSHRDSVSRVNENEDEQDAGHRLGGATEDRKPEIAGLEEGQEDLETRKDEWLEISTIFATVEQVSLESMDEGDCCICMEKKSDIVLNCAHTYCQLCIDDWRKQHNTCPLCMEDIGSTKDVWALPDKPNADEMTTYLMSIADSKGQKRSSPFSSCRPVIEEWERVSFE